MENFCPWEPAQYLVVSENTPPYLLYSHGIAIVFAVLFGFLIFYQNRSLLTSLFFFVVGAFSLWSFFDLIQWATNDPYFFLYFWSPNFLFEFLIFTAEFYSVLDLV